MSYSVLAPTPDMQAWVSQAFAQQAREYLAALPAADPQYPVSVVAEILSVAPKTVREYFALPRHHPRRLSYVDTTGSARGYRVRLSDLHAWQQRNRPGEAPVEIPVNRPAKRQAAKHN